MNAGRITQWVERLQKTDDRTKRRWLIAGTAAVMVIVIGLWTAYMGAVVKPLTSPGDTLATPAAPEAPTAPAETPENEKDGIFAVFARGVRVAVSWIGRQVSFAIEGLREVVQKLGLGGTEYTLQK